MDIQKSDDAVEYQIERLKSILTEIGSFIIAVSGGIDSTLLAVIAGRTLGVNAEMFHAVSPAVPERATQRVREFSHSENWNLTIANAGEFKDERYILNPIDRCYFCKTNLYSYIASQFEGQILSGTNLDDLSDFRPGLKAAKQHEVRHPYVEALISKAGIRNIANFLGLENLAQLPASPCLSSRVQTSIPIDAESLRAIDRIEVAVQERLKAKVVRCRIRERAIEIELDSDALVRLESDSRADIVEVVQSQLSSHTNVSTISFAPYQMGSAFVAMPG